MTIFPNIVEQLIAKLQRKRRELNASSTEEIESLAGMIIPEMVEHLKQSTPQQIAQWFEDKAQIAQILDRRDGGREPILISGVAELGYDFS